MFARPSGCAGGHRRKLRQPEDYALLFAPPYLPSLIIKSIAHPLYFLRLCSRARKVDGRAYAQADIDTNSDSPKTTPSCLPSLIIKSIAHPLYFCAYVRAPARLRRRTRRKLRQPENYALLFASPYLTLATILIIQPTCASQQIPQAAPMSACAYVCLRLGTTAYLTGRANINKRKK